MRDTGCAISGGELDTDVSMMRPSSDACVGIHGMYHMYERCHNLRRPPITSDQSDLPLR